MLIEGYRDNSRLIRRRPEELADVGCRIQPTFQAISYTWVLGHIITHRNAALEALGADSIWPEAMDAAYGKEALEPVGPDQTRTLNPLLASVPETTRRLTETLEKLPESYLEEIVTTSSGKQARYDHVRCLHWHETYHLGQRGLLGALAFTEGEALLGL